MIISSCFSAGLENTHTQTHTHSAVQTSVIFNALDVHQHENMSHKNTMLYSTNVFVPCCPHQGSAKARFLLHSPLISRHGYQVFKTTSLSSWYRHLDSAKQVLFTNHLFKIFSRSYNLIYSPISVDWISVCQCKATDDLLLHPFKINLKNTVRTMYG